MYVEIHDQLRQTTRVDATRVVIYDIFDNPIAVVVEIESGQYIAVTASHKKFNEILTAMGITKTVIVDHLNAKDLPSLT